MSVVLLASRCNGRGISLLVVDSSRCRFDEDPLRLGGGRSEVGDLAFLPVDLPLDVLFRMPEEYSSGPRNLVLGG